MKKIVSIIMIIVLLVTSNIGVMAAETDTKENYLSATVKEILPLMYDSKFLSTGNYCIGNVLESYKIEENIVSETEYEMYPVFKDDRIIAIAQLSCNEDGEYSINCLTSMAEAIDKYYQDNSSKEFAIIYSNEGILVEDASGNQKIIFSTMNDHLSSKDSIKNKNTIAHDAVSKNTELMFNLNTIQSRAMEHQILNVPYVENETSICSNCKGRGLCWAASIAMIVNYYKNTSYNAFQIHNATGCYSTATPGNYVSSIRQYGVSASAASYVFTYSTIKNLIQSDRLSFMRIERTTSSGESGHAIVPYGYYSPSNSNSKYFYFMDPNYGGGVATFPSSGTLSITTNGLTYTFDYYIATSY